MVWGLESLESPVIKIVIGPKTMGRGRERIMFVRIPVISSLAFKGLLLARDYSRLYGHFCAQCD
jgi:hypothetical protein